MGLGSRVARRRKGEKFKNRSRQGEGRKRGWVTKVVKTKMWVKLLGETGKKKDVNGSWGKKKKGVYEESLDLEKRTDPKAVGMSRGRGGLGEKKGCQGRKKLKRVPSRKKLKKSGASCRSPGMEGGGGWLTFGLRR